MGQIAFERLTPDLAYHSRISGKLEVILNSRVQANALIEPSRWTYVFGKWT